eukprot:9608096-Prorocentrum_lima.AAC.1
MCIRDSSGECHVVGLLLRPRHHVRPQPLEHCLGFRSVLRTRLPEGDPQARLQEGAQMPPEPPLCP